MNDEVTGNRIEVKGDGNAGPHVIVPESQTSRVRELFESNNIPFYERKKSITDPKGTDTIFDLGQGVDIEKVQSLLDGAD